MSSPDIEAPDSQPNERRQTIQRLLVVAEVAVVVVSELPSRVPMTVGVAT